MKECTPKKDKRMGITKLEALTGYYGNLACRILFAENLGPRGSQCPMPMTGHRNGGYLSMGPIYGILVKQRITIFICL